MRTESECDRAGRPRRRAYRPSAKLDAIVLGLLEESERPLSAYEIANICSRRGTSLTAVQAYRVLDRLIARHTVARIELLSAYLTVSDDENGYLVCQHCRTVSAFPFSELVAPVNRVCDISGFRASRSVVEVAGKCAKCKGEERYSAPIVTALQKLPPSA